MRDLKLSTIIERFVKELQSENSSIVLDPSLIKDIVNQLFVDEYSAFVESVDDSIGLDWLYDSPLQYELDFEEHYDDGTRERTGLFIRIYLAATYDKFTLRNAMMYGEEISDFVFGVQGDGSIGRDHFFKAMKLFNKNLPEDLRLFLELNY